MGITSLGITQFQNLNQHYRWENYALFNFDHMHNADASNFDTVGQIIMAEWFPFVWLGGSQTECAKC